MKFLRRVQEQHREHLGWKCHRLLSAKIKSVKRPIIPSQQTVMTCKGLAEAQKSP